jgi:acyl-CoA synthetase (NDP forming)
MSTIDIIDRAKSEGRTILTEVESKQILGEEGIPVARAQLAATREEAVAAARQIGLPVVLKIV